VLWRGRKAEEAEEAEAAARELDDLRARVSELESELATYRGIEARLTETLLEAETAANRLVETARLDCERIVDETRDRARTIVEEAQAENEQLALELRRLRSMEGEEPVSD
jgi:cell division septum initiation protein DivIVA